MKKEMIHKFLQAIEEFEDTAYINAVLIYNISPVTEGRKPAAIITFNNTGRNLKKLWKLKRDILLQDAETRFYELCESRNSISIIFYNAGLIEELLHCRDIVAFYEGLGYNNVSSVEQLFSQLGRRYKEKCPHEIGLLLGIPIDDVRDFMKDGPQKCLDTGYWKVYNNLEEARATFKKYDDIREKAIKEIIFHD